MSKTLLLGAFSVAAILVAGGFVFYKSSGVHQAKPAVAGQSARVLVGPSGNAADASSTPAPPAGVVGQQEISILPDENRSLMTACNVNVGDYRPDEPVDTFGTLKNDKPS